MKRALIVIFCCVFLFPVINTQQSLLSAESISETKTIVRDGLSYENAIIIEEKTETAGIPAEYAWIREHYLECNILGQSLTYKDGKPYDVIKIKTKSSETKNIYFDISSFYGGK